MVEGGANPALEPLPGAQSGARAGSAAGKETVPMLASKRTLAWINVLGGTAVLASYAWGVAAHPESRGAVWGDVPAALQPVYTVTMLLAAAGYFAFTHFVFRRLDPKHTRVADRFGYGTFNALYALILLPSALWMPLTFAMLESPSGGLWIAIRLTLALVGLGSIALVWALLRVRPRAPGLAVAGSVAFTFQTAFLDALIWPAFFPV